MENEPKGKVLDVPIGAGVLATWLKEIGLEVSCCAINFCFFSIPNLKAKISDLNQLLPCPRCVFDYLVCLDGIEDTKNRPKPIRECQKILKNNGEIFLSIPTYLNIEERLHFLLTGTFSKTPSHGAVKNILKGVPTLAHFSPLGYPPLKFNLEEYGFCIL